MMNQGNLNVPVAESVKVVVTAHKFEDGADLTNGVELGTIEDFQVAGMVPGHSGKANITLQLPPGLDPGGYVFIAKIENTDQLNKLDQDNNSTPNEALT